jgi:hypothetical protein
MLRKKGEGIVNDDPLSFSVHPAANALELVELPRLVFALNLSNP